MIGKIRVVVRGFANGSMRVFEEPLEIDAHEIDQALPAIAERHAEALMLYDRHYIEIEFLDEPDQDQRFFRFGTDPSAMVLPLGFKFI